MQFEDSKIKSMMIEVGILVTLWGDEWEGTQEAFLDAENIFYIDCSRSTHKCVKKKFKLYTLHYISYFSI